MNPPKPTSTQQTTLNQKNYLTTTILTLISSIFAIFASTISITNKSIYLDFFNASNTPQNLLAGSIAQDMVSIPLGVLLFIIAIVSIKRRSVKGMIAMIGLSTYFFYAYGIYAIQGSYTSIYLVYLAIFSLSIYGMIWGFLSFQKISTINVELPKWLRITTAVFLVFILCVLIPGWLARIAPDIAKHTKADTYAVYILDLGIVFPALLQIAIMLFRKKPFANVLAGIALIKVFTICLSWGFAEFFVAFSKGIPVAYDMAVIASTLTVISLILIIPYFRGLKVK